MYRFLIKGLLTSILVNGFVSLGYATTISGTISLPNGVVAGSDGATVELRGSVFEGDIFSGRDTVVIQQGSSSANYSLEFSEVNDQFVIFECVSGCFEIGVTTEGWWDQDDGVVGFLGTSYLTSTDHIVDIVLEVATLFSGKVNFPINYLADEELTIFVVIESNDQFSFSSRFSIVNRLDQGQTDVDFKIGVPSQGTSSSWQLSAYCFSLITECAETLIDADNYATTAQGNPLTLIEDDAFEFLSASDYLDLELTLIGPEPQESVTIIPQINFLLDEE